MNVKELIVRLKAEAEQFKSGLASAQQSLNNLGNKFLKTGAIMTAAVTTPLVMAGKSMLDSAMQLEATEAKYKTVFGNMTGYSDEFIAKFRELTPATTAEARSMASSIQDLLVPMGFVRDDAAEMTGEFMHVIGALTNFNSATHTAQDVAIAMQAAITGEYESLKRLGVQLSATEVEQKALEMGLISSKDEMNKQVAAQVVLAEVYRQSGDALDAYTEENLDAKTKLELMKKEIIEQAAQFGNQLLPMLERATEALKSFNQWLAGLSDGQRQTILQIMALVAALGPVAIVIGSVMKIGAALIGVIKGIGVAFVAIKGVIAAAGVAIGAISAPVLIAIAVIGALVAAGVLLYKHWDTVKEYAVKVWTSIADFFTGMVERIREIWTSGMERVKTGIATVWDNITTYFGNVWESIRAIGGGKAGELFDAIQEKFMAIWDFIVEIWTQIKEFYTQIWEAIKALFRGDLDAMNEHLQSAYGGMFDFIRDIWNRIKEFFISVWEAMKQGVKEKVEAIRQAIVDTFNRAIDWIKSLPSQAVAWGRSLISGFINGVKQMASSLVNAVKGVVNNAIDAAKSLLGISSPSKVFFEIGGDAGAGFIRGIRAMTEYASQAMQQMVQPPQMNLATATPTGGVPTKSESHITLDMNGLFAGANITIGSEKDAQSLVREIYRMAQSRAASEGVRL